MFENFIGRQCDDIRLFVLSWPATTVCSTTGQLSNSKVDLSQNCWVLKFSCLVAACDEEVSKTQMYNVLSASLQEARSAHLVATSCENGSALWISAKSGCWSKMDDEDGAESKFWGIPELKEKLLLFLDPYSALCLVQSQVCSVQFLQARTVWRRLVRRTCPYGPRIGFHGLQCIGCLDCIEKNSSGLLHLAKILKTFEEPKSLVIDLLHVVVERFPAPSQNETSRSGHLVDSFGRALDRRGQFVQVSCNTCLSSHSVSLLGFLILEEIMSALVCTEQKVLRISVEELEEPWISALASHLSRQTELPVGIRVDTWMVHCNSKTSAEAFLALMLHRPELNLCDRRSGGVAVYQEEQEEEIGPECWEALAKALQLCTQPVRRVHVGPSVNPMAGGRREDVRRVWEALAPDGSWSIESTKEPLLEEEIEVRWGEEGWARLEQILDLGEAGWRSDQWSTGWASG